MQQTIEENSDEAVKAAASSVLGALWMAPNFAAQVLVFAGTLYFFLLTGDEIYRRIPGHPDCLRQADRAVSQYFLTVSAINICLGIAVFGVMTLVGMEHPALWGAAACVLNFALYLGPLAMLASLFVAGLMQFHGGYAVVPMLAYLALNMTEAQFVTPSLVGQQMSLNPLIVFLAILFGLWLWGPVGGIVALPVLVWIQAFLDDPRDICAEPEAAMAR
jgi:predicted PurR-regulated permease PerM